MAAQVAPPPAAHAKRFDLINSKTMSPALFSGAHTENYKAGAKKIKAYNNMKLPGHRQALDLSEKLGKDKPVDAAVKCPGTGPTSMRRMRGFKRCS